MPNHFPLIPQNNAMIFTYFTTNYGKAMQGPMMAGHEDFTPRYEKVNRETGQSVK